MSEQNEEQNYHCSQLFGYKSRSEKCIDEDNISALKFDHSGELLALGDRAGRLIVFKSTDSASSTPQYDYSFEFQSHDKEFDTLKNLNIGEEICHINWLRPQDRYHKIVTANSNSIKLWKIYERSEKRLIRSAGCDLNMPHLQSQQSSMCVNLRKTFPNKNFSPFNCVNVSSNQQYLFTSDESNILLWSLQQCSQPYLLKQFSYEANKRVEKSEKITCAQLHPQNESMYVFGTNKGAMAFNDTRSSITHANSLSFSCQQDQNNFLSEIINQYSAVMFLEGTRKIVTRDLISIKVWDMCNNKQPLASLYIDQNIKSRLCDLFEADCLDDRFGLTNAHGNILTGNYSNSFHLIDSDHQCNLQYELDFSQQTICRRVGSGAAAHNPFNSNSRVLGHDYNLVTGQLAISTHNCFFIYSHSPVPQIKL